MFLSGRNSNITFLKFYANLALPFYLHFAWAGCLIISGDPRKEAHGDCIVSLPFKKSELRIVQELKEKFMQSPSGMPS